MLGTLHLLTADPELGAGLHEDLAEATRQLDVVTRRLDPGPWGHAHLELEHADFGLLILDGWIAREVQISRRISCDLVGPGDILQRPVELDGSLLAVTVDWHAVTAVRLAILDTDQMQPWPDVQRALLARLARRSVRMALANAIVSVPGIETRIVTYLSHLAASWGTVTKDGIVVDPPLSHARLAQLIGSRRPTVTAALGRLKETGVLDRRTDGRWLLRSESTAADLGGRRTAQHSVGVDRRARPPGPRPDEPPTAAAIASLRVEEFAARLESLRSSRRAQLDAIVARSQTLRDEADAMRTRTQRMRADATGRRGGSDTDDPAAGAPQERS